MSLVFLFDVDNTLLDNDQVQADLRAHLTEAFGKDAQKCYWEIFEELREELGYADYLGAMQRFRVEQPHNPCFLEISYFMLDYPFANRLYPRSIDVVQRFRQHGTCVILSDGDVILQPRKVQRSGLFEAFAGKALIFVHKEDELAEVERLYPARHYVMIDDKLRILDAIKRIWGERVTTVFVRQGHYAHDPKLLTRYRPADVTVDSIGDLLRYDAASLGAAARRAKNAPTKLIPLGRNDTMRPTERLHAAGQSIWLDEMKRSLLASGTLRRYVDELSVTGLTSNPTIFDKAISSKDYDDEIARGVEAGYDDERIFYDLAVSDLTAAAEVFAPVHTRTGGVDGWVSLEVSPHLADDAQGSITAAQNLHAQAGCHNLFIKIPGTRAGVTAIEESIYAGVPVNVTLLFSPGQYLAAAEAYIRGLERRIAAGLEPNVASVASIFVSRWDTAVKDQVPKELRNQLGIAIGKKAYAAYRQLLQLPRWQRLMNFGARPQRLLFASTSTKDPLAPDDLYVRTLVAPLSIDTMPEATLQAFADHGSVGELLPCDGGDADELLARFKAAGVDVAALAESLQLDGAAAFATSWDELLKKIAQRRQAVKPGASEARSRSSRASSQEETRP